MKNQTLRTYRSGNPIANFSYSYAFAEGWSTYSEGTMLREALDDGPETAIGQLQGVLLGDVRVLSSIGRHTGGMRLSVARIEGAPRG